MEFTNNQSSTDEVDGPRNQPHVKVEACQYPTKRNTRDIDTRHGRNDESYSSLWTYQAVTRNSQNNAPHIHQGDEHRPHQNKQNHQIFSPPTANRRRSSRRNQRQCHTRSAKSPSTARIPAFCTRPYVPSTTHDRRGRKNESWRSLHQADKPKTNEPRSPSYTITDPPFTKTPDLQNFPCSRSRGPSPTLAHTTTPHSVLPHAPLPPHTPITNAKTDNDILSIFPLQQSPFLPHYLHHQRSTNT